MFVFSYEVQNNFLYYKTMACKSLVLIKKIKKKKKKKMNKKKEKNKKEKKEVS